MTTVLALIAIPIALLLGAWLAASLDGLVAAGLARRGPGNVALGPLREAAALLSRPALTTEAPDALNWRLAPAWYLALAAVGLSVVPLAPGVVGTDIASGIVLWGACEALTVVVVFLHGWSPNSPFPLIGAYRYVAVGLPVMLPSMFVLIAAALPAQSLALPAIVESQREVWNVVRQPLGLVLFMAVGLTLTLRGPFDYADGGDLAGGTSAEDAGAARALWQFAQLAMLVSFSAMAATVFLGGYLGPGLPGWLWLALKTAAVLAATVLAGHALARTTPSRMLTFLWVVLLPLSFATLVLLGLEVL